jgi:GT2 family glycosyltransferase
LSAPTDDAPAPAGGAAEASRALLLKRRADFKARAELAEDRWARFQRASRHRLAASGVRHPRIDSLLARGKWPGRAALIAHAGVWTPGLQGGLGATGGRARGLVAYVRAGPDPKAQPKALFDQAWYLARGADLLRTRWAPLAHYLAFGDREGRSPHPLLDLKSYRARIADDPRAATLTALQHFVGLGARAGLDPHPLFSVRHYVGQCEEVARSGENPLMHYLRKGWRQGLQPHPLFAGDWYLAQNLEAREAEVAPLLHYVMTGAQQGCDPHPLFDAAWYVGRYRDAFVGGYDPLSHYLLNGAADRRSPTRHFDATHYLAESPQAAEEGVNPLVHYLTVGAFLGASPAPDFDEIGYLASHEGAPESGLAGLEHWVRSRAPRPSALSGSGDTGAAARSVFEQMRTTVRGRDPGAYDNLGYADLMAEHRRVVRVRRDALEPKPPPMIRIAPADVDRAAAALRFAAPEAPKVSVVIPVHNHLGYTLECLASLAKAGGLGQTEILVIDDASTDRSGEVLPTVAGLRYLRNPENLGFIRTCNRAAAQARGRYLVFLNNDVQVRPDWLSALCAVFDEVEDAGAAAPKMLFPDGRLQEAGARIGRDGASEMIGFLEDPDAARWNVRREVDYASGACLMVERQTFLALGGFDELFAPAYCEDSDLCFRLRERGLKVIYEPRAVIVHHLSVTSDSIAATYKHRLATRNQQRFVERWGERLDALNRVKTIAFHLPQFHAIPENDRWWGAGFTEWTNVTRALPNYRSHYQPHLPADLGFYDLSQREALVRQAALARRYGVHGFCHYFYWFSGGRRVLERPLEHLIAPDAPDFPFCLCWANENWTRTWDGEETDVLLAQTYAPDDAQALIEAMTPYLKRPNYIRVGGRPLLLIYRASLLPNPMAWAQTIREHCRREGLGEVMLAYVEVMEAARERPDPASLGFDASVEFPPSESASPMPVPGALFNPRFRGVVNDYRGMARRWMENEVPGHRRFRGVTPSWDNTPRRQDASYVFHNASPGAFQAWLEIAMAEARRQNAADERLVFVNAWNEWAEGAHLEPDVRFGHGWLEAVKNAADADLLEDR